MPAFPSNPYPSSSSRRNQSAFSRLIPSIRRRPFLLFGLPFTLTIVSAAYGLSYLTETRYEYNATKVSALSKEEELGMKKDRRKIDLREEYFKLGGGAGGRAGGVGSSGGGGGQDADAWDNWEPKRVPRPEGTEEWGAGSTSTGSYVESASNTRDYKGKQRDKGNLAAEGLPEGAGAPPMAGGNRVVITPKGEKLVIGPDGKPCRSCSSRLAFAEAMRGGGAGGSPSGPSKAGGAATTAAGAAAAASASDRSISQVKGCPPDVEELGRSTWDFLHSVAAVYPDSPTPEQRGALLSLLTSLPLLYPCGHCAEALGEDYERRAAGGVTAAGGRKEDAMTLQEATASKKAAAQFMCSIHNEVNERLGKPVWNCDDLGRLKRRWEDGGERCF